MSQTLLAIRAYSAKPLTGPVNIQRDKQPDGQRVSSSNGQRTEREELSFLHYLQQITQKRSTHRR